LILDIIFQNEFMKTIENDYCPSLTCNMCKGELPALMKGMNIETLNIYSGRNSTPMILTQP